MKKIKLNKTFRMFIFGILIGVLSVLNIQTYFINKDVSNYKLDEIISVLEKQYIDEFDKEDFVEYMYKAGLTYFNNPDTFNDPYTMYFPKQNYDNFKKSLEGSYSGIGISLKGNEIQEVFENSPADKAGLLPKDLILKIDQKEVNNDSEIVNIIKEYKDGKEFILTVKRENKIFEVKLKKKKIKINVVSSKPIEKTIEIPDEIGYISLKQFTHNSYTDFVKKIEKEYKDKKGIIIDLRGNPGGYLTEVQKMLMYLCEENDTIFYEKYKNKLIEHKGYDKGFDKPIVVLVDKFSISAAEVMAASLQENKKAVLVGVTTYGKGVIQSTYSFDDGSGLKFTIGKWLTPNKNDINHKGIKPDYIVKNKEEQLLKAIEILKEKIKDNKNI